MNGISSLTLLGTVAEIEQSTTKNGKLRIKLLLEVKRYRQATDTSGQDEVTLIPVNLLAKIADTANEYLRVGDAVAITARVSGTEFNDRQTGKVKRGVTLTADVLHLLPQREARLV